MVGSTSSESCLAAYLFTGDETGRLRLPRSKADITRLNCPLDEYPTPAYPMAPPRSPQEMHPMKLNLTAATLAVLVSTLGVGQALAESPAEKSVRQDVRDTRKDLKHDAKEVDKGADHAAHEADRTDDHLDKERHHEDKKLDKEYKKAL